MRVGKVWSGRVLQPKGAFQPVAWGAGLWIIGDSPAEFGLALMPPRAGAEACLTVWRRGDEHTAIHGDFHAPGSLAGDVLIGTTSHDLDTLAGTLPFDRARIVWFPLPEKAAPGFYMIDVRIDAGDGPLPFAAGVKETGLGWSWDDGYFSSGGTVQPTRQPFGMVWATRDRGSARTIDLAQPVIQAGPIEVEGFRLSISEIDIDLAFGTLRAHMKPVDVPPPANGCARYDMVSVNTATGQMSLHLGSDRAMDAEEYPAAPPPGHTPLYSIFTTRDGIEPIELHAWRDMVKVGREAQFMAWLERSRQQLPRTTKLIRTSDRLRLAGYGDSLTALGGRAPEQITQPNGRERDTLGYFEQYGADWYEGVPLFSRGDGGRPLHHRLGWNWRLKAAIEDRSGCLVQYDNWGIPGTTSEPSETVIDGHAYPNCASPKRLEPMLSTRPDLVVICIGMNDIGNNVDTRGNLVEIGQAVRSTEADLVFIPPPRPGPDFNSRDDLLWRTVIDEVATAARDLGAPVLPIWDLYGDGNEGAMGLSRRSHCAATRHNHPGARELAAIGSLLAKIIP